MVEIKVYSLEDVRYPDDIKYSLVCTDKITGKKVLFDNHHPKGHHFHIDEKEYDYNFTGVDELVDDFRQRIIDHFDIVL